MVLYESSVSTEDAFQIPYSGPEGNLIYGSIAKRNERAPSQPRLGRFRKFSGAI